LLRCNLLSVVLLLYIGIDFHKKQNLINTRVSERSPGRFADKLERLRLLQSWSKLIEIGPSPGRGTQNARQYHFHLFTHPKLT
jgi:hypothetical protein